MCYYQGLGKETDFELAFEWFTYAAEAGNIAAMYKLGDCYYYGQGVVPNTNEAINWYRKAADEGHEEAKTMLNELGTPYLPIIYSSSEIFSSDGVYHGPDWEYDYTQTTFYYDCGTRLNRNCFSLSFDYFIDLDTDIDDMIILMLSASHREFGLRITNGYVEVITDNTSYHYTTNIRVTKGEWNTITLSYNNGTLSINNQVMQIHPLDSAGDNILSTIKFSNGDVYNGLLRNIVIRSAAL